MKTLVMLAAVLSFLALDVFDAHAKSHYRRIKRSVGDSAHLAHPPKYQPAEGWYEHIADHLPFGSKIWWEQMDREGRGGFPRR